jgi:hypothetical protein
VSLAGLQPMQMTLSADVESSLPLLMAAVEDVVASLG